MSEDRLRGANGQLVEILEIGGQRVEVDVEIADLVRVLNANGYPTIASCSGHGFRPGIIALRDGRELIIARDYDEARRIDAVFPLDINGNSRSAGAIVDALRPFAAITAEDGDDFSAWSDEVIIRCEVTVGEIKRARAAVMEASDG